MYKRHIPEKKTYMYDAQIDVYAFIYIHTRIKRALRARTGPRNYGTEL